MHKKEPLLIRSSISSSDIIIIIFFRLIQTMAQINGKQDKNNICHKYPSPVGIGVHQPFYHMVQETEQKDGIKPPGQGAFQADHPLVIKRLILVIPPYRPEQMPHNLCHQKLKSRGHQSAHNIQSYVMAVKWPQKKINTQCAKSVNRAKRPLHKPPIG